MTAGRAGRVQPARVDGLREARAALAGLPAAFREVVAKTLREGGAIIEAEAKQRVRKRSGETRDSIGTNERGDGLQVAVGSGLPRARWLELGTSRSRKFPFLYPAFRRGARHVRKEMRGWGTEAGRKVRFKTKRYKPKVAAE